MNARTARVWVGAALTTAATTARAAPDVEVPLASNQLLAGDVNGDGWVDLVGGWNRLGSSEVALGDGAGGFLAPEGRGESAAPAALVDADGDGFADLFSVDGSDAVVGFRGGPDGLDVDPAWGPIEPLGWDVPKVASLGDVNADGFPDLAVGTLILFGSPAGPVDGGQVTGMVAAEGSVVSGVGDVSGDGIDDVVVPDHPWDYGSGVGGPCRLYLGSPTGLVVSRYISFGGAFQSGALAIGVDPDGDGDRDLVLVNLERESYDEYLYQGSFVVYDGMGPDVLSVSAVSARYYFVGVASIGDPDGDGAEDLLFAHDERVSQLPYDPALGFGAGIRVWGSPTEPVSVPMMTADVDHDGLLDLIAATAYGASVGVWFGEATAPPDTGGPPDATGDTGAPSTSTETTTPTEPSPSGSQGSAEDAPRGCGCDAPAAGSGRFAGFAAAIAAAVALARRRRFTGSG